MKTHPLSWPRLAPLHLLSGPLAAGPSVQHSVRARSRAIPAGRQTWLGLLALVLVSATALAQPIGFTGSYAQNFDGMGPTGLVLPPGWRCGPAAGPLNPAVAFVSDGSSSALGTYNYGTVGSSERAVGGIAGPTTGNQAFRVAFVNNSGQTLTQLQLRYDGEQWRVNGNTATQSLTMQISVGSETNFTALPANFDFASPVTTGSSALNGNLPANRTANIGGPIAVNIAVGEIFHLQWFDANDPGNDHGLAIDNVTLTSVLGPPYRVDSVSPERFATGEQVVITGAGFGNNPDDLCLVAALPGGAVPLRAITATDTRVVATVGPVPPGGGSGPVMFAPGTGVVNGFQPVFPDLAILEPSWTLTSTNSAVVSPGEVTMVFTPPPTNTHWFYSTPAANGTISLVITGRCPVNTELAVVGSLRMSGPGGLTDIDFSSRRAVFQPGGSALECARRLCDMIVCAVLQNSGVLVECIVTELPGGAVRITLRVPGGTINPGSSFTVCLAVPALPRPAIAEITPLIGGQGTIFTVLGSGFGQRPQDLCFMFGREDGSLQGGRVLTAADDRITVEMGAVTAANAGPGWRGMMVRGIGNTSATTDNPDVLPGTTFAGTGDPVLVPQTVTLVALPPVAGELFDDSRGPTPCEEGGVVSVVLENAECEEGTILKLDGHWDIVDCTGRRTHIDAWLAPITYRTADGSCAQVIADALAARFYRTDVSTAGFPIATWVDTDPATGKDRLNLACDNGDPECPCCIIGSWVRVHYCPPVTGLGAGAGVSGVVPSIAASLEEVLILGGGFGNNPDNLCVVQMGPGGVAWPLRAQWAEGDRFAARTAPVPAGVQPGPIMVMGGQGVRGPAIPVVWDDLIPGTDGWFFRGVGSAVQGGFLTPIVTPPPPTGTTWITGELVDGAYCLYFSNACPANTILDVQADFGITSSNRTTTVDQVLNGTVWTTGGTALDCARRVCDLVVCGLASKLGVRLICEVTQLPGGVAKVTLRPPAGVFTSAYLSVCLTPPAPRPPPIIFEVTPLLGTVGDILTVRGTNFPTDPNDVCLVIDNGNQLLPLQVLTAEPDKLTAEVGFVPADALPGPLMIALGNADLRPPVIAFPDVQLGGPFWAWGKVGPAAGGEQPFLPLPGMPEGQDCIRADYFDGRFCLTLTNNWPTNSLLCIIARAHNAAGQGGDVAGEGIGIFPSPGSTPLDCARRLAAILVGEFQRQSSVAVVTTVEDLGDGLARVCIAGATQPLTSGWLSICFKPCVPLDITAQPVPGQAVLVGQPASMSVTVAGTYPTYQWERNGVPIPGATRSSYQIAAAAPGDAGVYRCRIANLCSTVISAHSLLVVAPLPWRVDTITPPLLASGDRVVIRGVGFGNNPDNLCIVVDLPGTSVPLRAVAAADDEVIAIVGPVPPGGGTGPVMLAPGEGVVNGFPTIFPDLAVTEPAWTLTTTSAAAVSAGTVTVVYTPPPTNTHWFYSDPALNGTISLVLTGRCPINVQLTARANLQVNGPNGLKDVDVSTPGVVWQPGGSALECARRFCDMIVCAVWANSRVRINCDVTLLPGGGVRVTLSVPGGTINLGSSFSLCVAEPVVPRPVITDITPVIGGMGTIFTVNGLNFGSRPQDICFLFGRADGSLQLSRVMSATDTRLTVELGFVSAANAGPGWRGMMVRGTGNTSSTSNNPDDLPGTTFAGAGDPVLAPQTVTLVASTPAPDELFDDSQGPTPCAQGGIVSVVLANANCVDGTLLKLDGHWDIVDCNGRRTHIDAWLAPITYRTADGSCAQVIADALAARFYRGEISTAGFPITTWVDTDPATGRDRLNMACDNGDPDCPCCIIGSFVRAHYCPPVTGLGAGAGIAGVTPEMAGSLEPVTVLGTGFGADPDGLCIVQAGPGGVIWPLRAAAASPNQVGARTTPIPAGAGPGPLMMMGGLGVRGPTIPVVWNDLRPGVDGWFFRGAGAAVQGGVLAPNPFLPMPPDTTWITGELVDGRYCLYFSNACPANTVLDLQADFSIVMGNRTLTVDQALNGTVWTTGGTALDCARRVCDLVVCGLASKLGVRLDCEVTQIPGGVAKVTLSPPEGVFRTAYLGVCLRTPQPDPDLLIARGPNGTLIISWGGGGWRLQQAANAVGPYVDVPGNPASPVIITPGAARQFYRLIQP